MSGIVYAMTDAHAATPLAKSQNTRRLVMTKDKDTKQRDSFGYNHQAVQDQIERDRRRTHISKREATLIHALLKGRSK